MQQTFFNFPKLTTIHMSRERTSSDDLSSINESVFEPDSINDDCIVTPTILTPPSVGVSEEYRRQTRREMAAEKAQSGVKVQRGGVRMKDNFVRPSSNPSWQKHDYIHSTSYRDNFGFGMARQGYERDEIDNRRDYNSLNPTWEDNFIPRGSEPSLTPGDYLRPSRSNDHHEYGSRDRDYRRDYDNRNQNLGSSNYSNRNDSSNNPWRDLPILTAIATPVPEEIDIDRPDKALKRTIYLQRILIALIVVFLLIAISVAGVASSRGLFSNKNSPELNNNVILQNNNNNTSMPTSLSLSVAPSPSVMLDNFSSIPSNIPSSLSSEIPTQVETQTLLPTQKKSHKPTQLKSQIPTLLKTNLPSKQKTSSPTKQKTDLPTLPKTHQPSHGPSLYPTQASSLSPSSNPSLTHSNEPTLVISGSPSFSIELTLTPTFIPSEMPSDALPNVPTAAPTKGCQPWCAKHEAPWTDPDPTVNQKCKWPKTCGGCPQCSSSEEPPSQPSTCKPWCANNSTPWWDPDPNVSQKCKWIETCAECPQCSNPVLNPGH